MVLLLDLLSNIYQKIFKSKFLKMQNKTVNLLEDLDMDLVTHLHFLTRAYIKNRLKEWIKIVNLHWGLVWVLELFLGS